MKNKSLKYNIENSNREKVTRFSIRKVSFGAASVAVAALFMALGQGSASAADTNTTTEANVTNAATTSNTTAQDNKKEEVATTTATTTPTTAEKAAEKINEKLATETNTAENKEQTTVKAEEPSTTSAETTKPAEETATTESNKPKSRKKRALDANDQNRSGDAATTDGDDDSTVNERDLHVVNPYFEDNGKPTTAEKWKVINAFDLIGWKPINPNQKKVVIANGKVTEYGGYGGVVNQTHPYSIPLALYKKAGDRTSKSDKFDGLYQDIDVIPGQEIVITQNTNTFGPIGSKDNRTILTVSYPERGNEV